MTVKLVLLGKVDKLPIPTRDPVPAIDGVQAQASAVKTISDQLPSQAAVVDNRWVKLQDEVYNTYHITLLTDTQFGPLLNDELNNLYGLISDLNTALSTLFNLTDTLPDLNGDMVFSCADTIGSRNKFEELLRLMRAKIEGSNILK